MFANRRTVSPDQCPQVFLVKLWVIKPKIQTARLNKGLASGGFKTIVPDTSISLNFKTNFTVCRSKSQLRSTRMESIGADSLAYVYRFLTLVELARTSRVSTHLRKCAADALSRLDNVRYEDLYVPIFTTENFYTHGRPEAWQLAGTVCSSGVNT